MAKFFGSAVKTGKLGGSVFVIRNGVTIERQYQPSVENPKSAAQVGARAKLKLISQLSEVVGPVLSIPKQGIVSSRNLFVRRNYDLMSYSSDTASIELEKIQLTDSVLAIPAVTATPAGGSSGTIAVQLAGNVSQEVDRVVYVYLLRQVDNTVRLRYSTVVSTPGSSGNFAGSIPAGATAEGGVILAYGIKTKTETARVKFDNLKVPSATQIAQLLANRILTENDVDTTETVGVIVTAGA